jgi:hypothetical protein
MLGGKIHKMREYSIYEGKIEALSDIPNIAIRGEGKVIYSPTASIFDRVDQGEFN